MLLRAVRSVLVFGGAHSRRNGRLQLKPQAWGRRYRMDNLRAPRGALLYSPHSGHGLEEVSLDLMADP
jgi:hypothetical protein